MLSKYTKQYLDYIWDEAGKRITSRREKYGHDDLGANILCASRHVISNIQSLDAASGFYRGTDKHAPGRELSGEFRWAAEYLMGPLEGFSAVYFGSFELDYEKQEAEKGEGIFSKFDKEDK